MSVIVENRPLVTIFYSLAALVRKIWFLPLKNKIHIFAPPCNILYIFFENKEKDENFPIVAFCCPASHKQMTLRGWCLYYF